MDEEVKTVYVDYRDWEPTEYCMVMECPYCGHKELKYNYTPIFVSQKFFCENCGKGYNVHSNV